MKLKKEDKLELYKEESKFFVDVAKLVFAGVILAGILKEDVGLLWLLCGGVISVAIFLASAYYAFKLSKNK
ncbi:MAG: ABC transporter permease [Bacteroidaceae bacterium]|nr:ABC transporter permease [Bacteroidaceae bacterium]